MGKLDGKVALITGGSQGIGEETALLFAAEGASVAVLASRSTEKAQAVADRIAKAGGTAAAFAADVRDPQAMSGIADSVTSQLGPIDVLVNAAGVFPATPCGETDEATFDQVMDVNVKGMWNAISAVAPGMRARRTGWIVNVSSVLGQMALANYAVYCASKGAVNMLTRSLAIEFGPDGLHVNAIAPGNTATPMNHHLRTDPEFAGFVDAMAARTPSGRTYSQPEEMAAAILYLCSADSKPVHGAILTLDEGFSLGF